MIMLLRHAECSKLNWTMILTLQLECYFHLLFKTKVEIYLFSSEYLRLVIDDFEGICMYLDIGVCPILW